jgi:hypothetical protein
MLLAYGGKVTDTPLEPKFHRLPNLQEYGTGKDT